MNRLLIHNLSGAYTMAHGLGLVEGAAVLVEDGVIRAVGTGPEVEPLAGPDAQRLDAGGRCALPGLIDPHTHLIYAGDRTGEFAQRLAGADYMDILKKGGGILSTVRATRGASREELLRLAEARIREMLSWGVTTVEVKSGYGLSPEHELKMLRVAGDLAKKGYNVIPTFLGAHAVPPEFRGRREDYVRLIVEDMLPAARELSEFCDVFMDEGAFTRAETEAIFAGAQELGYRLKLHADELASSGGAEVAGEWGAVSADHLLYPSEKGLAMMAGAGTVAVVLPATSFTLRKPYAPVARLRKHGLRIAVATDHNPGTSPTLSLPIAATLGVLNAGLTPEEALLGMTVNAARALGLEDRGVLAPGKRADILILDAEDPVSMFYKLGQNLSWRVFVAGKEVRSKP